MKKDKILQWIDSVERGLKIKTRQSWVFVERLEIQKRGEEDADFYKIWFKLCKLERIRYLVKKMGMLTRSQRKFLKEYEKFIL